MSSWRKRKPKAPVFEVVHLPPGQHLTTSPWRAYLEVIRDNRPDALQAAKLLVRLPILRHGAEVMTLESWSVANQFSLLETAETLAGLEDDGLVRWDSGQQIGVRAIDLDL